MMRSSLLLLALVACLAVAALSVEARPRGGRHPHFTAPAPPAQTPRPRMHAHAHEGTGAACSFNGFKGNCQDNSTCSGSSTVIMQPGICPDSDDATVGCCIYQPEPQPGCGTVAVTRALTWANMQLAYCQAPYMQPDRICSPICARSSNPDWNAYRSDCSGLVSYSYGVPPPGRITLDFAPYMNDTTFMLDSPRDLVTGDAINSVPREHIMLFVKWLNADFTSAQFIEEPDCVGERPYARVTDTDVKINDGEGTITLACNGMTFAPIRFLTNKTPC